MVKKLQARNEPRKGRGFGFVSCGSEELQQKAMNEMHGKEVDGREIAVKIAIDSPGKEDVDSEAAHPEAADPEAADPEAANTEATGTEHITENGVAEANDPPAAAAQA